MRDPYEEETYVLSTVSTIQTQLDNDQEILKGGDWEAGVKSSKGQNDPNCFSWLDSSFGVHTFPCNYFHMWGVCEIKALQRNMQCLHMNGSHTGNVTSLIFCIKLWRSSCQLQISPLYPADKRQSNKVYNCEVKH